MKSLISGALGMQMWSNHYRTTVNSNTTVNTTDNTTVNTTVTRTWSRGVELAGDAEIVEFNQERYCGVSCSR